ncbi:MAG: PAS domain-containing protein [Chloroflexota bacterium]
MLNLLEPSPSLRELQLKMRSESHERQVKLLVVAGVFVAYGLFFYYTSSMFGPGISALGVLPVAVSGWLLGMWTGLLTGLLCSLLNLLFLNLTGQPGWIVLTTTPGGMIVNILLVLIGGVVGRISDLSYQLRHEIDARKRADDELYKSEQAYRQLAEGIPIGLYRTTPRGEILYANPALVAMLGYPDLSALQVVNAYDVFVDPQDRDREQALFDEKGVLTDFEMQLRRADGTLIWVRDNVRAVTNEQGELLHYEGSLQDITVGKNALEEIKRLSAFNESIIETMAEGIVLQDARGFFTFVNPAGETLLGYSRKEFIGLHWTEIIPLDQQAIVQAADERRLRGESDRYEVEIEHKDGQRLSLLVSGTPLFEGDHFVGTLAVFTDITQLKQAEDQIRQETSRLAALVRAADKFNTRLELENVLSTLCNVVLDTLQVSLTSIYLCDRQQQWLQFAGGVGLPEEYFSRLSPIPISLYERFLQEFGPVVVIPDVREFPGLPDAELLDEYDIRTNVSVHLLREG